MRKKYNMLPALEILVEQVKFESLKERIFHDELLPPQKLISDAPKLVNEKKRTVHIESEFLSKRRRLVGQLMLRKLFYFK
jgi:hypothetical protein